MVRRLIIVAAGLASILGLSAATLAGPAQADVTQIYSPAPTGLARVCVLVPQAASGLCVHL